MLKKDKTNKVSDATALKNDIADMQKGIVMKAPEAVASKSGESATQSAHSELNFASAQLHTEDYCKP